MNRWLIKSEADCYSIDDLKRDHRTAWTGIRNYQARNFMRDGMQVGDLVLYYHSNDKVNGVYGTARVASTPHADETQFDDTDDHYDPKATRANPTWMCVDMAFVQKFAEPVTLAAIKFDPNLAGMMLTKRGSRLSVQQVSKEHYTYITEKLAK